MITRPPLEFNDAFPWMILCDFDGTISAEDTTDTLLARFALPGWERLEQQWLAGEIGSGECMSGQIALLDMTREALDNCLSGISIDPAFKQFVALARRLNVPLKIVSDGLDYAIQRILDRHGLGHLTVIANHLEQQGERSWGLQFPWRAPHCRCANGVCKCAIAQRVKGRVLMVGDGHSDFCVAAQADHVLAKGSLIGECRRKGIAHTAFNDFSDAVPALEQLLNSPDGKCPPFSFNPLMPWRTHD
ncbi:MtnX-like HAD-IB family phosphatase [Erwinia sorbitola]|nr:MtnX-like HAD-IB family phosphatase [Erwinia sorbitola]